MQYKYKDKIVKKNFLTLKLPLCIMNIVKNSILDVILQPLKIKTTFALKSFLRALI